MQLKLSHECGNMDMPMYNNCHISTFKSNYQKKKTKINTQASP